MFPGRYGRRNVVNRCSVVNCPARWNHCGIHGVGLLVQILDGGRGVFGFQTRFRSRFSYALVVSGFLVVWWVWVTSPRPISTGRLGIAAVHLRPINPVVCGWPYPIVWVGNLILKCASRLDAFSGYHVRT